MTFQIKALSALSLDLLVPESGFFWIAEFAFKNSRFWGRLWEWLSRAVEPAGVWQVAHLGWSLVNSGGDAALGGLWPGRQSLLAVKILPMLPLWLTLAWGRPEPKDSGSTGGHQLDLELSVPLEQAMPMGFSSWCWWMAAVWFAPLSCGRVVLAARWSCHGWSALKHSEIFLGSVWK